MVLRSVWRRRTRSLLTIAGIALGIAVVVALMLLAEGIASQITDLMGGSGAEITVMQRGIADLTLSTIDIGAMMTIAALPEVQWVDGLLLQILPAGDRPFFVVMGVDPNGPAFEHFRIVAGHSPPNEDEILLGRMAADFFGLGPGDPFVLRGTTLRVAGLYETGIGFEDAGGMLDLQTAQRMLLQEGTVSFLQVKVRPEHLTQVEAVTRAIEARLPHLLAYRSSEFAQNTPDLQTLHSLAAAVSLVGLVAGGLATMNTMLMSVYERTREIGTLRALGWRKGRVLRMILAESLVLSMLGGLVGVTLGNILVGLIRLSPALAGMLPYRVSMATTGVGLLVALLLGAIGGSYPAWRAARLQPAEALRYE